MRIDHRRAARDWVIEARDALAMAVPFVLGVAYLSITER